MSTLSGFRKVTLPAVTLHCHTATNVGGNSLQTGDLGVLEGGCESLHARHVATVAEAIIGQAMSEWVQVSTSSGFRSVTWPAVTLCLQILQLNATYLSETSALHSGNILASSTAPCGPSRLPLRLQQAKEGALRA